MRQRVGMKKVLTGALFVALLAAGAVSASTVAGREPSQVVSSSTSTTTSTTTATTTTSTTTTTTTTTTTPRKITICHHARGKKGAVKHVTIRINRSAWTAHQKHGDSIGACNTATAKKFHSRPAHIKKWHKKKK
jgi:ABC-type transport system substrate-binding protein